MDRHPCVVLHLRLGRMHEIAVERHPRTNAEALRCGFVGWRIIVVEFFVLVERILVAHERQHARLRGTPWRTNTDVPATQIEHVFPATEDADKLLAELAQRHDLRTISHLRRVARTIQDLDPDIDAREELGCDAISMAARLRQLPEAPSA